MNVAIKDIIAAKPCKKKIGNGPNYYAYNATFLFDSNKFLVRTAYPNYEV